MTGRIEREKRQHKKERRRDEESLYYILERDLDRQAIFPEHDGWLSQVPCGKRRRIDFVVKYGNNVYGIEVKFGFPKMNHFKQAEKYREMLNGYFLAYPSDWVGEAVYLCEKAEIYNVAGLISIALFRSHVIRKAKRFERESERLWKEQLLDDTDYLNYAKTLPWHKGCILAATALKDGCFYGSFTQTAKRNTDSLSSVNFNLSDWKGLALLYMATFSISLNRYFSLDYLRQMRDFMGRGTFNLWKWVQCGLVDVYSYSDRLWMYGLTDDAILLKNTMKDSLQENIRKSEWMRLNEKIEEWKEKHKSSQKRIEKDFANFSCSR